MAIMFATLIDGHALLAEWFLLIAVILCAVFLILDVTARAAVPSWAIWLVLGLFAGSFLII